MYAHDLSFDSWQVLELVPCSYLLKKNKKYGRETGLIASIIMASSMVPRALKTPQKVFPVTLAICSVATGVYYTKKIMDCW